MLMILVGGTIVVYAVCNFSKKKLQKAIIFSNKDFVRLIDCPHDRDFILLGFNPYELICSRNPTFSG